MTRMHPLALIFLEIDRMVFEFRILTSCVFRVAPHNVLVFSILAVFPVYTLLKIKRKERLLTSWRSRMFEDKNELNHSIHTSADSFLQQDWIS